MITDFGFGMTGDVQIKSQAEFVDDVYYYVLGYRSANADAVFPTWLGILIFYPAFPTVMPTFGFNAQSLINPSPYS